jgi:hypothetical protein
MRLKTLTTLLLVQRHVKSWSSDPLRSSADLRPDSGKPLREARS